MHERGRTLLLCAAKRSRTTSPIPMGSKCVVRVVKVCIIGLSVITMSLNQSPKPKPSHPDSTLNLIAGLLILP